MSDLIVEAHKHEMNRFVSFPDGRTVVTCEICEKTKETLVDERMDSIEGAISELNDALLTFAREMKVLNLRFQAFVDMASAYANGASEDIEAFKQLGGNGTDAQPSEI